MTTIDVGITEGDLLSELAAELLANQRQPGDVDAAQLADATGMTVDKCRKLLERKVKAGALAKVKLNGRDVVYRRKV